MSTSGSNSYIINSSDGRTIHPSQTTGTRSDKSEKTTTKVTSVTGRTWELSHNAKLKLEGAYGYVRCITDPLTREVYAGKKMKPGVYKELATSSNPISEIQHEIDLLRSLKPHPNVIKLTDLIITKDKKGQDMVILVMPWIGEGSFNKQKQISNDQILGICNGLKHIHDNGFMYLDMKGPNVVFNEQGIPVIVDLGYMIKIGEDPGANFSPQFVSPEQLNNKTASNKSDIFSLGCMLFEKKEGVFPYEIIGANSNGEIKTKEATSPEEAMEMISNFSKTKLSTCLDALYNNNYLTKKEKTFFTLLLHPDPNKRGNIDEVIKALPDNLL